MLPSWIHCVLTCSGFFLCFWWEATGWTQGSEQLVVIWSMKGSLLTKVRLVKAVVFPVLYGCESWTVKKAEH